MSSFHENMKTFNIFEMAVTVHANYLTTFSVHAQIKCGRIEVLHARPRIKRLWVENGF